MDSSKLAGLIVGSEGHSSVDSYRHPNRFDSIIDHGVHAAKFKFGVIVSL